MRELSGKVCLLTGASGGIGAAVARMLAQQGVVVALVAQSPEPLEALAASIDAAGGKAAAFPCDITRPEALAQLLVDIEAALGPVALLVNNAGIDTFQHFATAAIDNIAGAVELNLTAPLVLTRLVLPGMLERGEGHVVSIASVAGLIGTPYGAVYAATKAGIVAASNSWRMEYADSAIGFSAVCPGFVNGGGMHEVHKEAIGSAPALLGGTTTDAVARAVLHAIKSDAAEPIVNSSPLRPLIGLGRALPGIANRLVSWLSGDYMRRLADHRQADHRRAADNLDAASEP